MLCEAREQRPEDCVISKFHNVTILLDRSAVVCVEDEKWREDTALGRASGGEEDVRSFMILSIAFMTREVRATGLRSFRTLAVPLFGTGITVECFHIVGTFAAGQRALEQMLKRRDGSTGFQSCKVTHFCVFSSTTRTIKSERCNGAYDQLGRG